MTLNCFSQYSQGLHLYSCNTCMNFFYVDEKMVAFVIASAHRVFLPL